MSAPLPTVMIISGDVLFAGAVSAALAAHFDVELVGTPSDNALQVEPGHERRSLVIHDIGGDGTLTDLKGFQFSAATLVLGPDDPLPMIAAVESGALGYVVRDSPLGEIETGAISVASGHAVIPPFMLGALLRHVVDSRRLEAEAIQQLELLTQREREVFELAAIGLGHDDVAERLFISPATARTHLHRIFKKLNVHSKAELVALAASCGFPTSEAK